MSTTAVLVIVAGGSSLWAEDAQTQEWVDVTNPNAGYTVQLPSDWEVRITKQQIAANSNRLSIYDKMTGVVIILPAISGDTFQTLAEEAADGSGNDESKRRIKTTRFIDHPQGRAVLVFQKVTDPQITYTMFYYHLDLGETGWRIQCQATGTEEEMAPVVEVCEQIGPGFRGPER